MPNDDYVRWFSDVRLSDVPLVGGKNASLGELYSALSNVGVRVPNGFALTAKLIATRSLPQRLGSLCTNCSMAWTNGAWRCLSSALLKRAI